VPGIRAKAPALRAGDPGLGLWKVKMLVRGVL